MKYYFISYTQCVYDAPVFGNVLIANHPLDWLDNQRSIFGRSINLISWKEISEEEYNQYCNLV